MSLATVKLSKLNILKNYFFVWGFKWYKEGGLHIPCLKRQDNKLGI